MTTKRRSLRNFRNPIGCLILLVAFAAAAGCTTAETPNGSGTNMNHVLPSGSSVSGWMVVPSGGTHASTATNDYIANNGSSGCTQCHGSDLSGGISNVSCFGNPAGCHHGPVAGWVAVSPAAQNHGVSAKKAPGSSGFASCQICHGADFRIVRGGKTCFTCHTLTPHASQWRTGDTYVHTTTDAGNAPVCALCHLNGANSPIAAPSPPAPAGTAAGCFNSTLCHGQAGHPAGWAAALGAPQPHGVSAKGTPGSTSGYAYCQVCHGTGTNFAGGSSGVSCYTCHVPTANSPHASQWGSGDTYVHTTTAEGNAEVCAYCHRNGENSPIAPPSPPAPAGTAPGCFNSTLCHGASAVPHPLNGLWFAFPPEPQVHGNAAKATPGTGQGFAYCQVCHGSGTDFAGGSSGVSCYTTCHLVPAPHPGQWRTGDNYVHTSTAGGNAPVCAFCHTAGLNSPILPPPAPAPGAQPDCYNNTLCHAAVAPHPVDNAWVATSPAAQPHGNSAKAAPGATTGFSYCQTCHGSATDFAGGLSLVSCYPCHGNVGTPHPGNWVGDGDYTHRTTNSGNATVCALCHRNGTNSPIPPPSPPAPGNTAPGCFNSTLCH